MKDYEIAVIPKDRIGNEVVTEGVKVLEAAGRRFGIGQENVDGAIATLLDEADMRTWDRGDKASCKGRGDAPAGLTTSA
jgi:isocitrate/isopropylmalate dehydrogenase